MPIDTTVMSPAPANGYIFMMSADELSSRLLDKFRKSNGYQINGSVVGRWRMAYDAYYGRYYNDRNHALGVAGEQGEFTTIAVNHLRNIVKYILAFTTQNRLVFDSQASNSDITARSNTILANQALDQYFYEKKYEGDTKQALELGLIMGTAFLGVLWSPSQKLVGVDGQGNPIYAGKPKFTAYSVLDVLIEPHKHDFKEQNWLVTREKALKWDLIALYPDQEKEIMGLPKIQDLQNFLPGWDIDDDHVWLYRAYHKATPALASGRYTLFCDNSVVLSDDVNPYKDVDGNATIPVFCFRPDIQYGTCFGHSPIFDLMPIQEATNLLDTTILSNQEAFGMQNIVASKRSAINSTDLAGGLKLIEVDPDPDFPNGGLPQALQLCKTPEEIFKQRDTYIHDMEQISGINSAARGNPDSSLNSGTAIALVSAQANTYNNSLEFNYTTFVEEIALALLLVMKEFMQEEEMIAILGSNNTYAIKTFKGEDFRNIQRVRITVGNPLARTLSGKLEIANNMLQQNMLKSPAEYLEVLMSGTLTPILESGTAQEAYIKLENDQLSQGTKVMMLALDNHQTHIKEHMVLLFRPDVRQNQDFVNLVTDHIIEHANQLEAMAAGNPMMLSIALEQPLQIPPPPGTPPQSPQDAQHGGGNTHPANTPTPASAKPPSQSPTGSQSAESALKNGASSVAASAEKRAEKEVGNAQSHLSPDSAQPIR